MKRKVLVVDIGGTRVKFLMSVRDQRDFASGPLMRPKKMIAKFKETVSGWKFDVVSIGFPAPVRKGHITRDLKHLGKGWSGFDFARALGKPARVINDAAMQALGSYHARSNAFSWTRGRPWLRACLGTDSVAARTWRSPLSGRPDH
jgi:predicted NBD/HSP70 family sugar kinase